MNNSLLDYIIWRGDLSFENSEFCEVDACILAHLAYEHIEGLVSADFTKTVTLRELALNFKASANLRERTHMGFGINPKTPEVLYMCGESERFGNIKVCGFQENLCEKDNEQFAAVTFIIGKTAVITFRGTDDTVTGWCEDLLLAKNPVLPSHKDGLAYINYVAAEFKGKLMVLGHSKGGTVAVYAGAKVKATIQKRITAVYNLDGPGWYKDFYEAPEFKRIENKVLSVYPACDIIGKVFYPNSNYKIINSEGKGIEQHDMLNWVCSGNKLSVSEDYTGESKIFFRSVNEWYNGVPEESRARFIDALIHVYKACGYKNNYDLMQNKIAAAGNMLIEFNKLDKDTKKEIRKVLNVLRKVLSTELPLFNFFNVELGENIKQNARKVAGIMQDVKDNAEKTVKAIKDSKDKKNNCE